MLTPKHVANFCNAPGNTCKYLSYDIANGSYVSVCTKQCPSKQPANRYATGDNCAGYPLLMYIPQGYDVDTQKKT